MARLNHAQYLASENWKVRRARSLYLAQHRCQNPACARGYLRSLTDEELREAIPRTVYRLEVHHLTYERLGHEADDDLIVLCPACHREQHGIAEPQPEAMGPVPMAAAVIRAIQWAAQSYLGSAVKLNQGQHLDAMPVPLMPLRFQDPIRTVDEQLRELGFPPP